MYCATCGTSSTISRRVWSLGGIALDDTTRVSRAMDLPGGPSPADGPSRTVSGLDGDEDRALAARARAAPGRSRRRAARPSARRPRRSRASSSADTRRSRSRRTQRRVGSPWPPSSKIVVSVTVAVAASCWAEPAFVTIAPVSGSSRGHSRMIRPSNRARSSASGSQTSTTARPPGARWSASVASAARWAARRRQDEQRVEGDEREAERPGVGQAQADAGPPRRASGVAAAAGGRAGSRAGRASIAGSRSTPVTSWPASASGTARRPLPTASSRIGPPVRPASARYRSRSPGSSVRSRSYSRASGRRAVCGIGPARAPVAVAGWRAPPSGRACRAVRRRTASALIASSAARLAAIAVVSAWSYGGETSTMSMPGELDGADDLADGAQDLAGEHPARLRRAGARAPCPGR